MAARAGHGDGSLGSFRRGEREIIQTLRAQCDPNLLYKLSLDATLDNDRSRAFCDVKAISNN
jgi:hypothetical protein